MAICLIPYLKYFIILECTMGKVLGNSKKTVQLLEPKYGGSCVSLDESTLWVTDGKTSTEFVSLDKPSVKGPDLPFDLPYSNITRDLHSMLRVDSKTIYLIGGDR